MKYILETLATNIAREKFEEILKFERNCLIKGANGPGRY